MWRRNDMPPPVLATSGGRTATLIRGFEFEHGLRISVLHNQMHRFELRQWRNYNFFGSPANICYGLTVLIHNSGHFGPLYRFGSLGPPALPGLPVASYATGL